MMTHHSVMTSSLRKNFKIDKFADFSSEIGLTLRWTYLEMLSPLQLTNVTSRRPKGASGGHEVSASRAAQASEARLLYIYIYIYTYILGHSKSLAGHTIK